MTHNKASKEILRDIFESTLSGFWDWNLVDNTEYLSPTFKRMFGYEDHEIESSPEAWQKIIFPEDLPGVLDVFNRHVKSRGQEPFYNEIRYRHRNGSTVWVICAGRVIEWAEDGTAIRMVGCHIDITKQKLIEQKLAESTETLSATLHSIGDGVITTDATGNVTSLNKVAEHLIGWTTPEVAGKPVDEIFHIINAHTREKAVNPMTRAIKEGVIVGLANDTVLVARDGTEHQIADSCAPIKDSNGNVIGAVLVFRDVTEDYHRREALRLSEERFRTVVENAPFGYYRISREGTWEYVNPVWEKMHALRLQDVVGKSFEITQPPEMLEKARENVRRVLSGETITGEFSRVTSDGRVEHHTFNIQPVVNSSGEITALEGFITDITDRKRADEALQQQAEELRARNDDLNRFNRVAIDRELAMIELKREVNDLCGKLGERPRHRLAEDKTAPPASTEAQA